MSKARLKKLRDRANNIKNKIQDSDIKFANYNLKLNTRGLKNSIAAVKLYKEADEILKKAVQNFKSKNTELAKILLGKGISISSRARSQVYK